MAVQHETIFGPASDANALRCKVVWREEYDAATGLTTVTLLELWAWAYTDYSGAWNVYGKITLRDANGIAAATEAAISSPDTFTGLGTTWRQAPCTFSPSTVDIAHLPDGGAAVEIGVVTSTSRDYLSYRRTSDGSYRDVVPAESPITVDLANHPQGMARIDPDGQGFVPFTVWIDSGADFAQYAPYADDGAAWTPCG